MAIIKSYTDIEQSKVLAEILSLESADMKILPFTERVYRVVPIYDIAVCGREDEIYAWSLAALIDILPEFIEFKGDKYYIRFIKEYVEYANDEVSITGTYLHTTGNNNLVDACYEMILKLHELNLL